MSNLVEIKELGKCYGKKKVMNNLSLSLESGRIVGILGPNGSGKSTLIKMMAGVRQLFLQILRDFLSVMMNTPLCKVKYCTLGIAVSHYLCKW